MKENESSSVVNSAIIGAEELADLLHDAEVRLTFDLGPALVYRVNHPAHGDLLLVNSTSKNAVIKI